MNLIENKTIQLINFGSNKNYMIKTLATLMGAITLATTSAFAGFVWEFGDSNSNPYSLGGGGPTATMTLGTGAEGWHNDWNLGSATGYWDLGKAGSISLTGLGIGDPRGVTATLSVRQWYDSLMFTGGLSYTATGSGITLGTPTCSTFESTAFGEWRQYTMQFTLAPGATLESLLITSPCAGATISEVGVNWSAVPEPTTCVAGALSLCVLGVGWYRQSRKSAA